MNVGDMDLLMSSTIIDRIYTIANQQSDKVSICYNADDVYSTVESGKLALILSLEEMAKLKIVCDLSHANDATFWEALELSSGKICCTHSNCASICCHSRNLTDSMMKALAEHGGVMGLCFYGEFIDQDSPSLERYVEHILHALTIMGPDHVGIGTDYDGVPPEAFMAISHPGHMNDLWLALEKQGVDEATMRKIAHENFLRLLSE
jgi:membrane dipeptidase